MSPCYFFLLHNCSAPDMETLRNASLNRQESRQTVSSIFPEPPKKAASLGPIAKASVIGLHLVSGMLAGGVIGYSLDYWLQTRYWLWIFFGFGMAAGFMNMYRDTQKLLREQEKADAAHRQGGH